MGGIKSTEGSWGEERKGWRDRALLCGNVIITATHFTGASTHTNHHKLLQKQGDVFITFLENKTRLCCRRAAASCWRVQQGVLAKAARLKG